MVCLGNICTNTLHEGDNDDDDDDDNNNNNLNRDNWVLVSLFLTTAWHILFRLRMEEEPPTWKVTANILNKQSRTADKRWSSSLVVGRGANIFST
jgi:hypothetical protein